mgnify:CR=1 FL=1
MQYKNKEQKHRINLEATMEYQEQSLGGQIFNRIRDDILSGNYTPGEELKEATLGKQLGVSRTPVREALRQLDLAREIRKPVIIHSRDAAKDTVDLMTEARAEEIGGVIHCYSYTKETAKIFLDMGFYFGIGGGLTFKNAKKLKEAVEYIPMDRIVLETDCPYLAPEPNRGKRNSSLNIPYVIAAMAQIKEITEEEVRKAAWDNSLKLYRMDK